MLNDINSFGMSAISAPVAQVYENRGTFLGLVPAPIITVSLVDTLDVSSVPAGKSITSKIQFAIFPKCETSCKKYK